MLVVLLVLFVKVRAVGGTRDVDVWIWNPCWVREMSIEHLREIVALMFDIGGRCSQKIDIHRLLILVLHKTDVTKPITRVVGFWEDCNSQRIAGVMLHLASPFPHSEPTSCRLLDCRRCGLCYQVGSSLRDSSLSFG